MKEKLMCSLLTLAMLLSMVTMSSFVLADSSVPLVINLSTDGFTATDVMNIVKGDSNDTYTVKKGTADFAGASNIAITRPLKLTTSAQVTTRINLELESNATSADKRFQFIFSNLNIKDTTSTTTAPTVQIGINGKVVFAEITLEGSNIIDSSKTGGSGVLLIENGSDLIIQAKNGNQDILKVLNNSNASTNSGIRINQSTLTIKSGTVYAATPTGGSAAVAIQFHGTSATGTLNIEGGIVSANTTSSTSAAIGRASSGNFNINISGGKTYAYTSGQADTVGIGIAGASVDVTNGSNIRITNNANVFVCVESADEDASAIGVATTNTDPNKKSLTSLVIEDTAEVIAMVSTSYRAITNMSYSADSKKVAPTITASDSGTAANVAVLNFSTNQESQLEFRGVQEGAFHRLLSDTTWKWMTQEGNELTANFKKIKSIAFTAKAGYTYGLLNNKKLQKFTPTSGSGDLTQYEPTEGAKFYDVTGDATTSDPVFTAQVKRNDDETWRDDQNQALYTGVGDVLSAITSLDTSDNSPVRTSWEISSDGSTWTEVIPSTNTYLVKTEDIGKKIRGKVMKGFYTTVATTEVINIVEQGFKISKGSGNQYTISIKSLENSGSAQLVLGAYGSLWDLTDVDIETQAININGSDRQPFTKTETITLTNAEESDQVRAFLWDSLQTMRPIFKAAKPTE